MDWPCVEARPRSQWESRSRPVERHSSQLHSTRRRSTDSSRMFPSSHFRWRLVDLTNQQQMAHFLSPPSARAPGPPPRARRGVAAGRRAHNQLVCRRAAAWSRSARRETGQWTDPIQWDSVSLAFSFHIRTQSPREEERERRSDQMTGGEEWAAETRATNKQRDNGSLERAHEMDGRRSAHLIETTGEHVDVTRGPRPRLDDDDD